MNTDLNTTLHPTLSAYIEASNNQNTDAQLECFAADAEVIDEGQSYRGTENIHRWITDSGAAYSSTLEPIHTTQPRPDGQIVTTCRVTGTFPGSPIDLNFYFTLQGDKIAALRIDVVGE